MSDSNRDSELIIPTKLDGFLCPNCDYDVRGLVKSRCPECGEDLSLQKIAAYKDLRWPPQKTYRLLVLATLPWFIAYSFVDAIHDTLDRVELTWRTMPFVVIEIQFTLAMVAEVALEASSKRSMKRFGAFLAIVVWVLILGHVAITMGTL